MQILAGIYKGVRIQTSPKQNYRPTQSKVRKSLFDILGDLTGKSVVDLYAGSGILGFEALSRGASDITFVETNIELSNLLHRNCAKFDTKYFNVWKSDVRKFLKRGQTFDVIIADPPYGQKDLDLLVDMCKNMLNDEGIFVLESSTKDEHIIADRIKTYGNTRLQFWRNQ